MSSGAPGSERVRTSAISLCVALTIHSAAAIAISRVDPDWKTIEAPIEIDVNEPPPPPEARPAPEPPREPIQAKIVPRKVATREPTRPDPPSHAPPPPNQESPPNAVQNAPPVFGVTMSSVVSGEATVAVPVGNTTMTKARSRPAPSAPAPYAADGTRPFKPVSDFYIGTRPKVLHEINGEDVYPPEARTLGIEGNVKLSIGIDERGKVVEVRVLPPRAGHGFDAAAVAAMWKFRFSPALTTDGRPAPYQLTYDYKFTIGN